MFGGGDTRRSISIGLVIFTQLMLLSVASFAQVPPSAEPGQIERQLERRLPEPEEEVPPVVIPERLESGAIPEWAYSNRLRLQGIRLSGGTVYPEDEFRPLYEEFLGQTVTYAKVFEVAQAIAARYGGDGYALVKTYVPAQTVDGGVVTIGIVEGFIDDIVIVGEPQDRRDLLRRTLEPILNSRPVKSADLERYIYLANELNGISVSTTLEKSDQTPGAATLTVTVEQKALDAVVSYDNRGSESAGPQEITMVAGLSNVLGLYERTALTYVTTAQREELSYLALSHNVALTGEGTALTLKAARSRSVAGTADLRVLDLRSKSDTLAVEVSHPLLRSRETSLDITGGFEHKNTRSLQLSQPSSVDRIRTAYLGGDFSFQDEWGGRNSVLLDLRQGVPIFNESQNGSALLSRSGGRNDYTSVSGGIERTQSLPANFSLAVSATGQWALTPLVSAEECGVGGQSYGRAYDSAEITGDHCAAGSVELRYSPALDLPWKAGVQLYSFYDYGATWNRAAVAGTDSRATLASAGGGLRLSVTDYLSGSLELAKPLTRPVADETDTGDGNDPRFFFRLTARY